MPIPFTPDQFATAAYEAAQKAQEAIDRTATTALAHLSVWFDGCLHVDGHIKVPNTIAHIDREVVAAAQNIKEAFRAILILNNYIESGKNFDVIVHTRPEVIGGRLHLGFAVLKRFPRPVNEDHERKMRETMAATITEMRETKHKGLAVAERAYEERFGEYFPMNAHVTVGETLTHDTPWRDEIAADGNLDSQPNYNMMPRL